MIVAIATGESILVIMVFVVIMPPRDNLIDLVLDEVIPVQFCKRGLVGVGSAVAVAMGLYEVGAG